MAEIIAADVVVMLAYATPASGAVLLPVNNYAAPGPVAGTISAFNSSLAGWRKLARIRANPKVAIAYHAREHGESERREYVLVQGRASLSDPIPDYPSVAGERWERIESWARTGALWRRWLRVYALRVEISIEIERVIVWPDIACEGAPTVHGPPLPDGPEPQAPPAKGSGPRIDTRRAGRGCARLAHALLGWIGADGFPMVVPVGIDGADSKGISLRAPAALVPAGGRRAGLCAHSFSAGAVGQNQRRYTGWLSNDPCSRGLLYAPHTQRNYRFPPSRTLYRTVLGAATRWELRGGAARGFGDALRQAEPERS